MSRSVRCPGCRSTSSVAAVWAAGDSCPRCLAPLAIPGPDVPIGRAGADGRARRAGGRRFSREKTRAASTVDVLETDADVTPRRRLPDADVSWVPQDAARTGRLGDALSLMARDLATAQRENAVLRREVRALRRLVDDAGRNRPPLAST